MLEIKSGTKPVRDSKTQINKLYNELVLVKIGQFYKNIFHVIGARQDPGNCMLGR